MSSLSSRITVFPSNAEKTRAEHPLDDYLFAVTREHFRSMIQLNPSDTLPLEMATHYYASAFIARWHGGWKMIWPIPPKNLRRCSTG